MDKPFVIYRSSAGSGKTFTLALAYLKLALSPETSYRSILAVTFTNKATKEMKSRIMEFLYALSRGEAGPVRESLRSSTGLSDAALTTQAAALLSQILHGYSYFAVMTIDAFFQKVIRAFAREVGLHAGFMLELDEQKVLDEVVDALLQEIGQPGKEGLTTWLTRFAEERVEEGRAWDFRSDIKELAQELFKENYKVQQETRQSTRQPPADIQAVQQWLRQQQTDFEQHLQQKGHEGLQHIAAAGLSVDDFAYKASGVAGYFVNLAEQKSLEPGKRVRQALDDPDSWTARSSPQKAKILAAVRGGLQACLAEAVAYYDHHHQVYYAAQQLQRFIYTLAILKDIEAKLHQYKQEHEVMLISDASVFLRDIIGKDDTPFVYEKMGVYYQHFLIDEFQDTSGLQWNNFRPLIENSLDAGHTNLVVGDVKQAIYRWRGGDWQLLLDKIQQDIQGWRTQVLHLDQNFRSKKNIVDFNNTLFKVLPSLLETELLTRLTEIRDPALTEALLHKVRVIRQAYNDAYQHLPEHYDRQALWQGLVQIKLFQEEELVDATGQTVDWKDRVAEQLPALVEQLQDQGYALRDVAFLVRNKKDGKRIVDTLMAYKSAGRAKSGYAYEVISPESLFLESSLSVGLLLDILRFLDDPYHVLAKGNILYKYHRLHHRRISSDELHQLFRAALTQDGEEAQAIFYRSLPSDFAPLQPYLNKLPLYELVENLVRLFGLNQGPELAYLQAFQDTVLAYSKTEKGDLDTFLQWWDERGKQTSVQISEQVDAMRILTIHKAKGLQFKVVILPFCDWSLDHNPLQQHILWTQTDQPPFESLGLMPMKYTRALINTVFGRDYYDEMLKVHLDNLNLLYVATTRAEECLYAFAYPKQSRQGASSLQSIAHVLYAGLTSQKTETDDPAEPSAKPYLSFSKYWHEAEGLFTLGYEPYPHRSASNAPPEKAVQQKNRVASQRVLLQHYPAERWRDRLMVRPVSRKFFGQPSASETMPLNVSMLAKDVLLRLTTSEDLEDVVQEVYFLRGLNEEQHQHLQEVVGQLLMHHTVGPWFMPDYDQVVRQQPLYSGQRRYTVPERLMTRGQQATVVHFDAGDEVHEPAVRQAMHTLREAGYHPRGFVANISTGTVTEVFL